MSSESASDITALLQAHAAGDASALGQLLPRVYQQLRRMARNRLRRERVGHTLAATELVHEAFLKLVPLERVDWQSRTHFYAIAWMYRDDYARGGFPMLAVVDPDGSRTARHSLAMLALLAAVSVMPTFLGFAGRVYLAGAAGLALLFIVPAVGFAVTRSRESARRTFFASLIYLPALLAFLVADHVPT